MKFTVGKTILSKVIGKTKRLLDKKDNIANFLLYGNALSINHSTAHFIYHSNLEVSNDDLEAKLLQFGVDIRLLEKSLYGKDRGLEFEVTTEELICEELNLKLPLSKYVLGGKYNDLSTLNYKQFNNNQYFYELLAEMNELFCENTTVYSDYLKITDSKVAIFNPELYCVKQKKYYEDLDIDLTVGQQGISLHKTAIDFFVKTLNINDASMLHYAVLYNLNLLILKKDDEYFCFRFSTNIPYPEETEFQPSWLGSKFTIDSDFLEQASQLITSINAKKIYVGLEEGGATVYFDKDKTIKKNIKLSDNIHVGEYCFNFPTFSNVLNSFKEGTTVYLSEFTRKGNPKTGNLWFFKNHDTSKFLASYTISKGITIDDSTKEIFKKQLEQLEAEIAQLNRKVVSE